MSLPIGDLDREELYLQGLAPSLVHGLVIIPADQSSLHNTSVSIENMNFWAFATLRNTTSIFLGVLQHFSFSFSVSHKVCVSVLSWPRLLISRIGLGPPSPQPTMSLDIIPGQSHSCILLLASPGIWTAIALCMLVLQGSLSPICLHHMPEWVMELCSLDLQMYSFLACYSHLYSFTVFYSHVYSFIACYSHVYSSKYVTELGTASLRTIVMGIAEWLWRGAVGNCIKANVAPSRPRHSSSMMQKTKDKYKCKNQNTNTKYKLRKSLTPRRLRYSNSMMQNTEKGCTHYINKYIWNHNSGKREEMNTKFWWLQNDIANLPKKKHSRQDKM